MKRSETQEQSHVKQRLMAAMCMLLICSLLLTVTSYAWLVMSTAPEVGGLTTNIGTNGSLEVALLNSVTRQDLTKISNNGGSLAGRNPSANNTWGNIVDLSYEDYGLNNFVLWPARLSADPSSNTVKSGLLSVPTYGFDGRIIEVTDNTISGPYNGKNFVAHLGVQDYGVRVIGTTNAMSVQEAALALAKANLKTYNSSAKSTAKSALSKNGNGLMNILLNRDSAYTDTDLNILKDMIKDLDNALRYIDLSLRNGLIAYAASEIKDEDSFTQVQQLVNAAPKLAAVLEESDVDLPEGFVNWVKIVEADRDALESARQSCEKLTGGSYTWAQFQEPLSVMIKLENVFINDDRFEDFNPGNVSDLLKGEITVTLASGSGIFADVSDFTGNYSATIKYMTDITITTSSSVKPPRLDDLATKVEPLEPANKIGAGNTDSEEGGSGTEVELTDTFGYAVDLAFRTNAAISNLLLQTSPGQRVQGDNESDRTMGGGSYMEFTSPDETFSLERKLLLMDAVRVAFIDDQGGILGIAKLNITNRTVADDGTIKAPLYLYTYEFDEETGALEMLQRRTNNNVITALEQNTAKAVTVVVWLDGDIVDNTMVSAIAETSLNGKLNLQFASSANLISANGSMVNISADKAELNKTLEDEKATYEAGGAAYTDVSWAAYVEAYRYAVAVSANTGATEHQIYMASYELNEAKKSLTPVSKDALNSAIKDLRNVMGTTDVHTGIVLENPVGGYYLTDNYTQEQYDNRLGIVYRVDYEKNLRDEGNGITRSIYTDESWQALAAALYSAETLAMDPDVTDAQINDAITALDVAQKALQRTVFYVPYVLNETIYYKAISDDTDTYNLWYDASFNRIYKDKIILDLDNKAELAEVATIETDKYLRNEPLMVTPFIKILSDLYPEFSEEKLLAVNWNLPDLFVDYELSQRLAALVNDLKTLNPASEVTADAETILTGKTTAADINATVEKLEKILHVAQLMEQYKAEKADADTSAGQKLLDGVTPAAEADKLIEQYAAYIRLTKVSKQLVKLDPEADVSAANNIINGNTAIDQTDAVIADMEAKIAALTPAETPDTGAAMTEDQRTVLTAAVAAAKAVEGYSDVENKKLDTLRTATTAAEELLKNQQATIADADAALDGLNAELKVLGQKQITAYNTLIISVPTEETDKSSIVYAVNTPNATLYLTGETGTTTITATILTKSGIVFTATKEVKIYQAAEGALIIEPEEVPEGGGIVETEPTEPSTEPTEPGAEPTEPTEPKKVWDHTIRGGYKFNLSADLFCFKKAAVYAEDVYEEDAEGNSVLIHMAGEPVLDKDGNPVMVDIPHGETIKSYRWVASDSNVVRIDDAGEKTCVVNGMTEGEVKISVSVMTYEGNEYIADMTVTVVKNPADGVQFYETNDEKNTMVSVNMESGTELIVGTRLFATDRVFAEKIESAKWSSSDSNIAYVSNNGTIYAREPGSVTISVTVLTDLGNEYSATLTCKVMAATKAEGASMSWTIYRTVDGVEENVTSENGYQIGDRIVMDRSLVPRVIEEENFVIPFTEKIVSTSWTCSTPTVISLTERADGSCELNALAAGMAKVTVTVVTDAENTYTASYVFEIDEAKN